MADAPHGVPKQLVQWIMFDGCILPCIVRV